MLLGEEGTEKGKERGSDPDGVVVEASCRGEGGGRGLALGGATGVLAILLRLVGVVVVGEWGGVGLEGTGAGISLLAKWDAGAPSPGCSVVGDEGVGVKLLSECTTGLRGVGVLLREELFACWVDEGANATDRGVGGEVGILFKV